ncbi:MAG: carbamate kinase [Thermomicrobiales bacterium]|nr:carbamate kinase [Thermomicrobiales bacterium]
MKSSRIVVALGGNALGSTPATQKESVKAVADAVVALLLQGHEVVIGHGNGPQVGAINLAFDLAHKEVEGVPAMPFAECNAMSQGYIGYHMQQVIQNAIHRAGFDRYVVSLVTQVEVAADDPAFSHPTKPIGLFYSAEEAEALAADEGWTFMEDSGRGYRRVVPSPMPKSIVELPTVRSLLQNQAVVITVGGGGIPVINQSGSLSGVDAVIDKDASCARIASQLNADVLLILTAVDNVYINFGTPDQQKLEHISPEEAQRYLEEGQFGDGSMKPKVEACLRFLRDTPSGRAVITSLENVATAFSGGSATIIANFEVERAESAAAEVHAD